MPESVLDTIWRELNQRIEKVESQFNQIATVTERAETAGGIKQSTLANAPLAVSGKVKNGDFLFITNGRKGAEGAGAGTGLPCYYNAATDQWFTFSGDIAVTV